MPPGGPAPGPGSRWVADPRLLGLSPSPLPTRDTPNQEIDDDALHPRTDRTHPGGDLVSVELVALIVLVAVFALSAIRNVHMGALAFVAALLVGVLVVGTASLLLPDAFPDQTVWSTFGSGYGFVPLVLPVLGLLRLRATR